MTIATTKLEAFFLCQKEARRALRKRLTADLIDLCEQVKSKEPRLAALAQTAYEEACLWAVKAATA